MLRIAKMTLKVFAPGSKLLIKRATFSPILAKYIRSNLVLLKKWSIFEDLLKIKLSVSQTEF